MSRAVIVKFVVAVVAHVLLAAGAGAQIPDTYENLQVLPKDIGKQALVRTMRQYASELGVRCRHCHEGPDDLKGMDFKTDAKPTKRAAREMMKMVATINATSLKALPPREEARAGVTCVTCHRGAARPPLPLDLDLLRAAEAGGGAAAVTRYRDLRRDHGADGQYDFRWQTLGGAAMRLAEANRLDDALVVARLTKEEYPKVAEPSALIGEILLRKGDRPGAAEAFREALAVDPQNFGARRGLKQIEEAQSPKPTPAP